MVMAHHGSILAGTNAFEMALDHAGRVDERLKELALVKAAMLIGYEFCIDIGVAKPQSSESPKSSCVRSLVSRRVTRSRNSNGSFCDTQLR